MIQIKIDNNQINEFDELVRDETGWIDLDSLTRPIRKAGFRGTGEITVSEIRTQINQRIKAGEKSGEIRKPPRINLDQTQNEFRFCILWRYEVDPEIRPGALPELERLPKNRSLSSTKNGELPLTS
jgi:hypothetical protein